MDAWRYGIYLLVFTFEDKFHISARPCIILYLFQTDYHTRARTPPTRSFFRTPFTYASSLLPESLEQATT